jgi:protein SCO1
MAEGTKTSRHKLEISCALCALLWVVFPAPGARAAGEHDHHQVAAKPGYARSEASYRLPDVTLMRADGTRVSFPKEIDDGKPVVLNFVYTTCTAICPVLSQTFADFQAKLGAEREKVRMVSISIDPEQDTPERLSEYAKRFGAGPQWRHYTGSVEASVAVQSAFQAGFGEKMRHRPVVFLRAAPDKPWVRLDGFVTPDELVAEYRRVVAVKWAGGKTGPSPKKTGTPKGARFCAVAPSQ